MEKRPNRYDRLYQSNPKEWEYYMFTLGFGQVLDYIGVGWRQEGQQISIFDRR